MTWSADGTTIEYFDGTEHDFLSNFHPSPFKWVSMLGHLPGARTVETGEHAFQAEKALHRVDYVRIITADGPGTAKRLGRSCTLRPDLEDVKVDVMRQVLRAKFAPGTEMAEMLLATGDAELVEGNVWHDNIWGNCICGRGRCASFLGRNLLGDLLVGQRNELLLRMEHPSTT